MSRSQSLRRVALDVAAMENEDRVPCGAAGCRKTVCRYMTHYGLCRRHRDILTGARNEKKYLYRGPFVARPHYDSTLRNPCWDPQWEQDFDGPARAAEAERIERLIAEVERRSLRRPA